MLRKKLFRSFLIFTIMAVIFFPLYTSFYLLPSFSNLHMEHVQQDAEAHAGRLIDLLIQKDGPISRSAIDSYFVHEVMEIAADRHTHRLKVYSATGEIIYSTDPKDIGTFNKNEYFLTTVARGKPFSKLINEGHKTMEEKTVNADMVETYIPIMKDGTFMGAIELYNDITGIHQKLDSLITRSSSITFLLMFILIFSLFISSRKAYNYLTARDQVEQELEKYKEHLEEIIRERTDKLISLNRQLEEDIAKRKKSEDLLQTSEEKYRSLVESTEDSIYVVDSDTRYLYINKKHLSRMGIKPGDYHEKRYGDFHTPDETSEFGSAVKRVFRTGISIQHEHMSKRDGNYFLRTLSPVYDGLGLITAVTVVSKDISEIKQMKERLHILSVTDELTELYNRRGFFMMAEQQMKISNRVRKGFLLLFADLDNLKVINDTFGHQEGDKALVDISGILRSTFRESDIVSRIGGDEFAIIPTDLSSVDTDIILSRLQKNIDLVNATKGNRYTLSISVGTSYYDPSSPSSIDELLIEADREMYSMKKRKRSLN